jgi:Zn-dependent peptidase ImmA (M78 family)
MKDRQLKESFNKLNTKTNIYSSCIVIILIALLFFTEQTEKNQQEILEHLYDIKKMEMYDKNIAQKMGTMGVFHRENEFYCVSTRDRTYKQINKTVNHELLHAMIHKDKKHFCEE